MNLGHDLVSGKHVFDPLMLANEVIAYLGHGLVNFTKLGHDLLSAKHAFDVLMLSCDALAYLGHVWVVTYLIFLI